MTAMTSGSLDRGFRAQGSPFYRAWLAGLAPLSLALALTIALGPVGIAQPQGKDAQVAQGKGQAQAKGNAKAKNDSRPKVDEPNVPLPRRPERTVKHPTLTSDELDRLVDHYLKTTSPGVEPAPLTSDIEFVRRVYLDLAGAPPTPSQVLSFIHDKSKDKRARLIDALLESPESARNWARFWRDVIKYHATNQNPFQVRYDLLEDWLTQQFRKNRPWDEIANALITATGRVDENGAVSFSLAHEAKPVELAGEVSRIFLGVQIQCAQCHDHKTDSWKRAQFHEFAAFFSGERSKPIERGIPGQLPIFSVETQGRARYTMPEKDNPDKQIPVAPKFFLASSSSAPQLPMNLDAVTRRALGASYVTGQDNTWFARAFVNRIWNDLMGESFYDGVDDLGPERTPKAKEVIEPLAEQWQQGGYDIRWLIRTIAKTRAYQRRVRSTANPAGKTAFASNCPSRLRSDQIVEALVLALGMPADLMPPAQPNAGRGPGAVGNSPKVVKKLVNRKPVEVKKVTATPGLSQAGGAKKPDQGQGQGQTQGKKQGQARPGGPRMMLSALFGVDPSVPGDDVLGTIPQALFLMNGPMVSNRTLARPGTVLAEILATVPDERTALNAVYLRVLSRYPNAQEVEIFSRYLGKVGNHVEALEDLYWALINSTEFISRR
ncbi:MAG: DUF1549 domain-containing protein [Isosphaeraceae bacterium]